MKLFAGLEITDYQDLFRAVGALIDEHGFRDVRVWEHEDGLVIQGRPVVDGNVGPYESYLLTDDDLRDLLNQAVKKRGMLARRLLS